ncbi:predicted protein [Sclerotinia sclerotiorum 1980 UF-70]|uniref:Uncharacterized protein n=1 Tax=Sclerotinia sclerotiorum (strain ATCC 18683 / 1980 / Ss-1) TaxID=665079 RepID=A7ERE1_SCLS1|nr:predicted protein [Sclerotinia sclerotiorum 1980 UF-70]EDN92033.1 predicted protein [Sclerotinia sclerotiorum 1980 UF-70]
MVKGSTTAGVEDATQLDGLGVVDATSEAMLGMDF